jgi:hypothetical protein
LTGEERTSSAECNSSLRCRVKSIARTANCGKERKKAKGFTKEKRGEKRRTSETSGSESNGSTAWLSCSEKSEEVEEEE